MEANTTNLAMQNVTAQAANTTGRPGFPAPRQAVQTANRPDTIRPDVKQATQDTSRSAARQTQSPRRPEADPAFAANAFPSASEVAESLKNNPLFAETTSRLQPLEDAQPYADEDITDATLNRYLDQVNQALALSLFRLNFNIHEATNMVSVQIIDSNTDEVIRELPPESRLDMMARIQEFSGILFDEKS